MYFTIHGNNKLTRYIDKLYVTKLETVEFRGNTRLVLKLMSHKFYLISCRDAFTRLAHLRKMLYFHNNLGILISCFELNFEKFESLF